MIGSGLAGLSAAWRLARAGFDVSVWEREARPGGRAAGESVDGYPLEPIGAVLSTADAALLDWIGEVGLRDELLPLRPVLSAQLHRDRVVPIDRRSLLGVARIPGLGWIPALSLIRFPRLLARYSARLDPVRPGRAAPLDDRSLADFGRLYFGPSVVDRWMAPLAASRCLTTAEETSRAWFLRRQRSHGRDWCGMPRGRLGDLVEAAAGKLVVHTGVEVLGLEAGRGSRLRISVRGDRAFEVDAAILATAAFDAARLAAPMLSSAERDGLGGVRYTPGIAVAVGLRRSFSPHPLEISYPPSEGSPLASALLEPGVPGGRVPGGQGLVTLRATGAWSEAHMDAPDDAVARELGAAFERTHPDYRNAVGFQRVMRVARALPRFEVGRYRAIAQFEGMQADWRRRGRRLYFAGDYRIDPSWNGAIISGTRAAVEVECDLARS